MGGRVALRFVSAHPELAASLTLEDSGMEPNPQRIQWIKDLLGSIPTPFTERDQARAFFQTHFADDPMTGSFLHANLETREDGTLDWRFHASGMIETIETGRAVDAMKEFSSLSLPVLIVRGSRSKEFPDAEARRMAQALPQSRLVVIEDAGHFVHAEKPVEFSHALRAFLRDCENSSGQ
jgi:esterase